MTVRMSFGVVVAVEVGACSVPAMSFSYLHGFDSRSREKARERETELACLPLRTGFLRAISWPWSASVAELQPLSSRSRLPFSQKVTCMYIG